MQEDDSNFQISISTACEKDIQTMVNLSYCKRRRYEKANPKFWKYAEGAEEIQTQWFKSLLEKEDFIILTAYLKEKIVGFIIGQIIEAPKVYNPLGLTLKIDDFCVSSSMMWHLIGGKLINKAKQLSKEKGAQQILVVCGAHDRYKRQFLKNLKLTITSEWYTGEIV